MSYSIISISFIIGVLLLLAGFLGRIGTSGISDVSETVASAFGLLVVYAYVIASAGSFAELADFFEKTCGDIPFLKELTEYGSLKNLFDEDPASAIINFLDSVVLAAIIDLTTMLLPIKQRDRNGKVILNMANIFAGVVVAIAAMLLMNYVIKVSSAYQWITATIGGIVTVVSVGTIPMVFISLVNNTAVVKLSIIGTLIMFSKSKIAGVLRSSFLKAVVYVFGIGLLEKHFGTVATGMSQLSAFGVAFGPVIVMLVGLILILKAVKL